MRTCSLALLSGIIALCIGGCGYRLGTVNPDDPIKTVYIPNVKNETSEPGIQTRATNEIITAFQVDGTYMVVDERDADAVLEIILTSYNRSALRFDQNDVTREYRLTIGSELFLRDVETQKVFWQAKRVEGETSFFVTVNLPASERFNRPLALKDLAIHIVERVTERW